MDTNPVQKKQHNMAVVWLFLVFILLATVFVFLKQSFADEDMTAGVISSEPASEPASETSTESTVSCGDTMCNGAETNATCPGDCMATDFCGDTMCNGAETNATCPGDCMAP